MILVLIAGMLYMVVGLLISLICLFLKRYDSIGWTIAFTLYIAGTLNAMIYNYAIKAPSAPYTYKSETVLKITHKDTIPVDTVVIYKKGE